MGGHSVLGARHKSGMTCLERRRRVRRVHACIDELTEEALRCTSRGRLPAALGCRSAGEHAHGACTGWACLATGLRLTYNVHACHVTLPSPHMSFPTHTRRLALPSLLHIICCPQ
eukprot:317728-Chlamydomonas_euryale.AAC.1